MLIAQYEVLCIKTLQILKKNCDKKRNLYRILLFSKKTHTFLSDALPPPPSLNTSLTQKYTIHLLSLIFAVDRREEGIDQYLKSWMWCLPPGFLLKTFPCQLFIQEGYILWWEVCGRSILQWGKIFDPARTKVSRYGTHFFHA